MVRPPPAGAPGLAAGGAIAAGGAGGGGAAAGGIGGGGAIAGGAAGIGGRAAAGGMPGGIAPGIPGGRGGAPGGAPNAGAPGGGPKFGALAIIVRPFAVASEPALTRAMVAPPSRTQSPIPNALGAMMRAPLGSKEPLVEPTSTKVTRCPSKCSSAWRPETWLSFSAISPPSRPMLTLGCVKLRDSGALSEYRISMVNDVISAPWRTCAEAESHRCEGSSATCPREHSHVAAHGRCLTDPRPRLTPRARSVTTPVAPSRTRVSGAFARADAAFLATAASGLSRQSGGAERARRMPATQTRQARSARASPQAASLRRAHRARR